MNASPTPPTTPGSPAGPASPAAPAPGGGPGQLTDIDMKIDEQAHKLIELKQKFTYFLVTAAIAIIAFAGKFLLDYGKVHREALALTGAVWSLLAAAAAGMLASAAALASVYLGHMAYTVHVKARYSGNLTLGQTDQEKIEERKGWQSGLLLTSMILLVAEIALSLVFFTWVMW